MHSTLPMLLTGAIVASFAGTAHAATVDKAKFTGSQVATTFSADATITCNNGTQGSVFALGSLSGSQSITKEPGTNTVNNGIYVEVDAYSNSCTGVSFGFSTGGISGGFSPPNNNLVSSSLTGAADVQDFDTGATLRVVLNVAVAGTGAIFSNKASSKSKTVQDAGGPVTITIDRSANASRDGTASGTISFEGFVLHPTFFSTTLVRNSSSTLTVTR